MVAFQPSDHVARSHEQREVAEGFGADAEGYERSRPSYPEALIERIIAESPGRDVLDVGCGTGIASRLFQRAGCRVLGLDADPRMADAARMRGLDVEVAKLEDWDPAGRMFDILSAAQAWHWIDPVAGAAQAASVLRAGARISLFWNAGDVPLGLRRAFADVYDRAAPGLPAAKIYSRSGSVADAYSAFLDKAAGGLARTNAFDEPQRWRFEWEHLYTRDEWLEQVRSHGGHNLLSPIQQEQIGSGLAAAIDAAGGGFTMSYTTVTITSVRC